MLTISDLYSLEHSLMGEYLSKFVYPFEALSGIKDEIIRLVKTLDKNEYSEVKENVWVHKSANIFPSAYLGSPCIIGPKAEVRHSAFIRGSAIVGEGAVVGNSTELKNVILFDYVQVPHYNYVGDSILGYKAHMGAGSITSNVKGDKSLVSIKDLNGNKLDTGIKKVGAMLGDHVEVGCNTVLNPGTVVGRNTTIYPLTFVRGEIPASSILKNNGKLVLKH